MYTRYTQDIHKEYILKPKAVISQDADDLCEAHPDVVVLACSILAAREVLAALPVGRLRRSTLFVDVLSVKGFPKQLMLSQLPAEASFLCPFNIIIQT